MMITPPYLQKGDKIAITCPAKSLPGSIDSAISMLQSWGLEVVTGQTVGARWHQFAGTDEQRTQDMQTFLDDDSIKAIVAARGGYGTVRIIDALNFRRFTDKPKWLCGFSDITLLHSHVQANFNIESIHGQMPLNVPDASKPSLQSLRKALFGQSLSYEYKSLFRGNEGRASAALTGGNLTLLVMTGGSVSEADFEGKILFIEDVGEYLYAIDRMMWQLQRAGKLSGLKGMIVGTFSDVKDSDTPFGQTVEEIIHSHTKQYNFPVCYNFPAGHIADNHALIMGRTVHIEAGEINKVSFG